MCFSISTSYQDNQQAIVENDNDINIIDTKDSVSLECTLNTILYMKPRAYIKTPGLAGSSRINNTPSPSSSSHSPIFIVFLYDW